MKQRFIVLTCLIIFLSSCSLFRHVSSRDNSNSSQSSVSHNKKHNKRPPNNISGGYSGTVPNYSSAQTPNHKVSYTRPSVLYSDMDIETADTLQLKYTIVLDATLEQLINVSLLYKIDHWWATPYCYGGNTESCIDCSAFAQTVMRTVYGIHVPRTAQEQFDNSKKVDAAHLREGDLVFFNTGGREASHVGVYLFNNKFVHASTSSGVTVSDLGDAYWQQRFIGAGRFNR